MSGTMQKQGNILDFHNNTWNQYVNHGMPPKIQNNPRYIDLWNPNSYIVQQFSGNYLYDGGSKAKPNPIFTPGTVFGDAWLFYQWASELGPDDPTFPIGMSADELASWNSSSPIYRLNNDTYQLPVSNSVDTWWAARWRNDDVLMQWKWSVTLYAVYVSAWLTLDGLWPGHVDDWWFLMYALSNTTYGNEVITQWIYDHPEAPQAVIDVIKNNHKPEIQQIYGLLNEPVMNQWGQYPIQVYNLPTSNCLINGWVLPGSDTALLNNNCTVWNCGTTPSGQCGVEPGPFFLPLSQSNPHARWGFPLWTYKQRYTAFMTILPAVAVPDGGKWSIRSDFLAAYLQVYIDNGWIKPDGSIPPIYDPSDPSNPIKVTPPSGGPGGITTKITDPKYAGNLPYAQPSAVPGQAPWAGSVGAGKGYYSPCEQESGILRATPPIAAFAATFLTAPIFPENAKLIGAVTVAGGSYLFVKQALSLSGQDGEVWSKVNAASWLSIGVPATLATLIDSSPKFPANKAVFAAAAGAVGYVVLNPVLYKVILDTSGFISPFAGFLNNILRYFGNLISPACWHQNTQAGTCPCSSVYQKEQTRNALLGSVYGTSGAQTTMRNQCLQVAMLQGSWGSDPQTVGQPCDMKQDIMPNPAACMNPAWWTQELVTAFPDANVSSMFANIAPCLDASNPSFLPPGYRLTGTGQTATLVYDADLAAKDTACQAQGTYFRSTPTGCQNFSNIN